MKIGEARKTYRDQISAYRQQKQDMTKRLDGLRANIKKTDDEEKKSAFGEEAAVLELSIGALDKKQSEYQKYLDRLNEQYFAYCNAETSKQQADAAEEYGENLSKIMEVARRLMKGAIVPLSDERKLMEFDGDLYEMAKSIGEMARMQKKEKEKYGSLWEDEEEKEYPDPREAAEDAEAPGGAPAIESAAETLASTPMPEEYDAGGVE